jgi:lysophospholipase L1-like esterase
MKKNKVKNTALAQSLSKTGKFKRFFFGCLLVIIPLILMEIFSFTYIKLKSDKGTYRERIKPVINPYHPYLGYVHAPESTYEITKGLSKKMVLKTDENGNSITPAFSYKDPDMTVIVTGGSTMFGVGSSDNATTVPSILERLINERFKIRAEVINLALRGGHSFQEMLIVDRFFAENQADLVLAISGRNDAALAFTEPVVESAFLRKHVWDNAVSLVQRAERGELMLINLVHNLRMRSYTFDFLYRQITSRSGKAPLVASSKLDIRKERPATMKERAKITATHFAAADLFSQMNDAKFVMFLQPTLYSKTFWTEQETLRMKRKGWSDKDIQKRRDSEHEFYEAFRETEKPFHLIDLADVFSGSRETLYIDYCHYNDEAAEKLAEKIFDSIKPILQTLSPG